MTEREGRRKEKRNAAGLEKADRWDPQFNDSASYTPCANKINLRIALSLKHSASDPFVLNAPGSGAPWSRLLRGSHAPNLFNSDNYNSSPIGPDTSHWQWGRCCQARLPPLSRAEEREENDFEKFRPLKNSFSSPAERGENGDEDKPSSRTNEDLREENSVPVPESFLWLTQWFKPLNIKLLSQKQSRRKCDALWNPNLI